MHLTLDSSSEDQTIAIGRALGRMFRPGDVIAVDGQLGAGKTRLVRGIASGMGLDESAVSSPTFVFVHEYQSASARLFHVDAYRLGSADELDSLGWDRVMDRSAPVVIEWADRIAAAVAAEPHALRVRMEPTGADSRRISLDAAADWAGRSGWSGVFAAAEIAAASPPAGWSACPVTGRPVSEDSPTYPFADAKARMTDLGRWLGGSYTVSREITPDDADDPDLNP